MSAPKKVPAERIEVMRELFELVNLAIPGPSINWMKTEEPVTPLIYPESYPKKIPPKEAKAQRR